MHLNRELGSNTRAGLKFKTERIDANVVTKKKTLSVYSLQGLGNCINNLPILLNLQKHFHINLHVMNNGSSNFFRELDFGFNIFEYKNNKEIISKRFHDHDMAISFYPNWKREIFALLSNKAKEKLCFYMADKPYTYLHLNNKIKANSLVHDIENNFKILKYYNIEFENIRIDEVLGLRKTASDQPIISLHPTASTKLKYYPILFWVRLVDKLIDGGFIIQLFSGPSTEEREYCELICSKVKRPAKVNKYFGQRFDTVAQKLCDSDYFLGLDSCLMHLSTLFGKKVVALWSYADYRRIFPYSDGSKVYLPKERWNCKSYKLPRQKMAALERACAEEVYNLLDSKNNADHIIDTLIGSKIEIHKY
jgi:ADP-heptose:LPS heptosyltransferase